MEKEKLKTLKDLTFKIGDFPIEVIKVEAIKWVNEEHWDEFIGWLRFEKGLSDEGIDILSQEEFTKYFIKYFFNLAGEDLK